tara:strand:- start:546 stop:668 length:123 start_codon:yes stop_codon:yes gene_type:complete
MRWFSAFLRLLAGVFAAAISRAFLAAAAFLLNFCLLRSYW